MYIIFYNISACNTEGDIRLVNGGNKFEGRVEVCQGGQWKTVCNRMWGNTEAEVVCRRLQFSGDLERKIIKFISTGLHVQNSIAHEERDVNVFGEGSGQIVEVEWDCEGGEASLLDCRTAPRNCGHDKDAGVYCFGKTNQYITILYRFIFSCV